MGSRRLVAWPLVRPWLGRLARRLVAWPLVWPWLGGLVGRRRVRLSRLLPVLPVLQLVRLLLRLLRRLLRVEIGPARWTRGRFFIFSCIPVRVQMEICGGVVHGGSR